ncbi:alpha/beta hydrolase [uncultured Azohydromonas sp.]|jgi:Predicted hydrolases or acyltransferases (alpha/beta hydrolase superfamily)|uniref:alpha/beta fold hydrolase n=1 Tax=uncultured Azohydromonas sp. TaxID=487342 RepID=UPI00262E8A12|nr:alpha/beta hydrolase [uncultured Azohydromonas sp.]
MSIGLTDQARSKLLPGLVAAAAVLGVSALVTRAMTRKAERENPPRGHFVSVDGVRLHYTVHGAPDNPPLVLLHGNGASATEMEISGLVELAARHFRVYVFDRPGYGHSERPTQGHRYTPQAQARLFLHALRELQVERPIVLGHSWGSMVAFAMGLAEPQALRALVLASGYYTPSLRLDAPLMGIAALPVLGTLMRHTISPLLSRAIWPLLTRRIFAPRPVTEAFKRDYPTWMSLRPHTLQASAAEAGMMIWEGIKQRRHERELAVPTVIVAGAADLLVVTRWQSQRLHARLPQSRLRLVPGEGHMVHHTATPAVMEAIAEAWHMSEPLVTTSSSLAEAALAPVQPLHRTRAA